MKIGVNFKKREILAVLQGAVGTQGGYLVPEWLPAAALAPRVVTPLGSPAGRLRHPAPGRDEPAGTRQRSLARGGAHSCCTAGRRAAAGRGLTSGSVGRPTVAAAGSPSQAPR